MARCTNKTNLHVHHIRIDGGNGIDNARVLCRDCHVNTGTYGSTGHESPPEFTQETKDLAKKNAGN